MITMTKGLLTDPETKTAFQKLHTTNIPFTTAYNLKKIALLLTDEYEKATAEYKDLFRKHATQLKEGVPEGTTHLEHYEIPKEGVEEFRKELTEFLQQEVKIDWHTLNHELFSGVKMSAKEWSLLEPIFGDLSGLTPRAE